MDLQEWNLSFQTHLDSSKNIKNSHFCAILKIFCHSWLRAKKGYFRQNMDFWAKKPPKKSILRDDFKMPRKIRFLLFFAENFTGNTLNRIFWRPGGGTISRLVFTPLRPTLVEVFPSDGAKNRYFR